MTSFAVRKATVPDIGQLRDLIARSARGLSAGFYSAAQTERAISHVYGVDSQLIADGTMYVAEEAGVMIGCGGWSRRRTLYGGDQYAGRIDGELDPRCDPARIRAFFVDPRHARRGVARALLAACEEAAAAAGFRRAELMATLPGVPLYSALGFEKGEAVAIDMGDGLDLPCFTMTKDLPAPRA